ncbi:glycosyltransferase [Flavobacterium sp. TAB 87]|uniref:glycosyltransferase n=1 Tax=Flavobacterium sp. TAB 87 TaxID=1729581 RepID=UPI00076C316C|nr:glycosyltransferase [Flavobacterium sp. TAB 87]KVV15893.1 Glycosyltransferase KanE [Flavobacterium sp. TAB 87]
MTYCIITHVNHIRVQDEYFAYAPYVREMNIWLKNVDIVSIVAPITKIELSTIDLPYQNAAIDFREIPELSLTSLYEVIKTVIKFPFVIWQIYNAMHSADHIHLRCPGNIGLLGCLVQILFPNKIKTAKYAGNWDPKSTQPWSYRLQKWILSNTFLTKNMQVLVYGEWEGQSKNIKPFFTASYTESEIKALKAVETDYTIRLLYVGTLVSGKNPMYAIEITAELLKNGRNVKLDVYGDGPLKNDLIQFVKNNNLADAVFFHGNQNATILKEAYQNSHILVLASKSEGWPKAVAEAMFWGCIPAATSVSCVPYVIDYGNRGILLTLDLYTDAQTIEQLISDKNNFENKRILAATWSRKYTLDYFEAEIQKLLKV